VSSPLPALPPDELLAALRRAGGNVAKAARQIGILPNRFDRLLARAGYDVRRVRDFEDPHVPIAPAEVRTTRPRPRRSRPLVRVGLDCERPPSRVRGAENGSACAGLVVCGEVEVTERRVKWVEIDAPVPSSNAFREEWHARKRRVDRAHKAVLTALGPDRWTPPPLPGWRWRWRVTFTRVSHQKLDGHDNLRASFKNFADCVCSILGFKTDRDPRIEWRYTQAHTAEKIMVRRFVYTGPKPRLYDVEAVDAKTGRRFKAKRLHPKVGHYEMRSAFRSFFRVLIEHVKVDEAAR
jgi:hypothetical protein